ncbi:MAG TPA: carboxypeptidase-like regulatory domain-containing protein [Phycisphaerae bacterium]|nr:carboxypeptidase-like regulatory domain-containing protein [Phycisphaerae bacterium]
MQAVIPGQANTITHNLLVSASGEALTSGTVSFHLLARSGANSGKWWDGSAWSDTEAAAGVGVHKVRGIWQCDIGAAAWEYGVLYESYAVDSLGSVVVYSEQIVPSLAIGVIGAGDHEWVYTLTDSTTGLPLPGATVTVTGDAYGENPLYRAVTDAAGQVTFHLPIGMTVYVWRELAGYYFVNPDTEVVD